LEKLESKALSCDYDVSSRTIYRDMQKISEILPIRSDSGIWQLDIENTFDGSNDFHQTLLGSFARNLEIDIKCFEKSNISKENVAYAIEYKHLPKNLGEQILHCIQSEEQCTFSYIKDRSITQRKIDPIKIYTENSRWYVIARDYKDDKVKYFNLAKIKNFKHLKGQPSTLTHNMIEEADKMKSIWSSTGEEEMTVKLYVKPEISQYIKDIKLHKSQILFDEHHDGGLEVHCMITHKLELLPQIKYWLPRIHIIEPKWLREELINDLEFYRDENNRFG
jgi:predicted DNA-binding transcriptional regulator YafY